MNDDNLIILDHRLPARLTVGMAVHAFLGMAAHAAQKLGASEHEIATMMWQMGAVNREEGGPNGHEVHHAMNDDRGRDVSPAEARKALHEAFAFSLQQQLTD